MVRSQAIGQTRKGNRRLIFLTWNKSGYGFSASVSIAKLGTLFLFLTRQTDVNPKENQSHDQEIKGNLPNKQAITFGYVVLPDSKSIKATAVGEFCTPKGSRERKAIKRLCRLTTLSPQECHATSRYLPQGTTLLQGQNL